MQMNTEQKEESPVIFHVENLNLSYGDKHVLHDINMDIRKNHVTAFIGPSGCGKSTFLRCLNRMNDLISDCKITGKIEYMGKDVKDYNPMVL